MCIVLAAINELGEGRLINYLWPSGQPRRSQLQKTQFESQEGRSPIPYFCYCSVITANVVNLWFKTNDSRGRRPNWAISSDIRLLLIAPTKILGREGSM